MQQVVDLQVVRVFGYGDNAFNWLVVQSGSVTASELIGLSVDERFSRAGSAYLTDLLGSTVALASGSAVQTSYA